VVGGVFFFLFKKKLKKLKVFFGFFWGGFFLVPNVFPMCSQHVPNSFVTTMDVAFIRIHVVGEVPIRVCSHEGGALEEGMWAQECSWTFLNPTRGGYYTSAFSWGRCALEGMSTRGVLEPQENTRVREPSFKIHIEIFKKKGVVYILRKNAHQVLLTLFVYIHTTQTQPL
jgi:hypothetical protein